jgi:hypothetical protein
MLCFKYAGPGGRAVLDMGLRLLGCCDCGFETRQEHGRISHVNAMCYDVQVSATGQSLIHRSPTECVCFMECDQVQIYHSAPTI